MWIHTLTRNVDVDSRENNCECKEFDPLHIAYAAQQITGVLQSTKKMVKDERGGYICYGLFHVCVCVCVWLGVCECYDTI